jgi:phage FluMu protein Com
MISTDIHPTCEGAGGGLRQINAAEQRPRQSNGMAHLIIRCPRTGTNVQVWLAKDPSTDQADTYESVTCPACQRLHFINKTTGKLLGDKEK